ncbi:MAG: UDP-N-acetylglucosamine--N-acetylmuramyl-(pentapeptide) pyrophosphoryl-undecaprenol N-acetylglucosamine transferase [Thermomicrobiales bacterium]
MVLLQQHRTWHCADATDNLRVVVAAGGTGGHVFPGLAIAAAIERRLPSAIVTFSGTPDRLEGRLVPASGYELDTTPMAPFPRRLDHRALAFPARFLRSVIQARRQLRARRAHIVIGVGGYPSVPAVVAAWTLRIPILVHESNAAPGLANMLAGRLARHVACAFDPARTGLVHRAEVRQVGIPIMPALAECDRAAMRAAARAQFNVQPDDFFVVVSGGSLGAAVLDRAAADLACKRSVDDQLKILIKASATHAESLRTRISDFGGSGVATVVEHIEDMAAAYAAADAVVVRAGACTVAEVQHLGVPAVVVPLPGAAGDHQTANAQGLVRAASAPVILLRQAELSAGSLQHALNELRRRRGGSAPGPRAAQNPSMLRPTTSPHSGAADAVADWAIELARTANERAKR